MPTLRRVHVATPGSKKTRNGASLSLSSSDLAELAASYSPNLHQCKVAVDNVQTAIQLGAPAVLGHLDPRLVQAKGAMPAFGRVLDTDVDSKGLWLDLELTDAMAKYMTDGLYDHVSLSWYDRNDSRNPTPGKLHIRHLGILGSEGSSMKDLELPNTDLIEFSESTDDDGNVYHVTELTTHFEFAESDMDPSVTDAEAKVEDVEVVDETVDPVQLLIDTLSSGDKGYKGEITGFNPEPTVDNSYLWDADKQQFAGQFLDNSGNEEEVYDFTLVLESDGSMTRSYKRLIADDTEADPELTDKAVEAEADAADEPAEFGEGCGTDKPKEMSEADGQMFVDTLSPELGSTVTVNSSEYEELKAKSVLYGQMLEAEATRRKMEQMSSLQSALQPLYDMGLISPYVASDSVARALMAMSDEAEECCDDEYSLEFSEGEVHTSPMQTVLAVFAQISANAKVQKDTDIEFGEMDMPDPAEDLSSKLPAGVVSQPTQAALDKKARQYCKDNGLDCKDSKQYMKAIRAVS